MVCFFDDGEPESDRVCRKFRQTADDGKLYDLEGVQKRGHEVHYVGPRQGEKSIDWPDVTLRAMEENKEGKAEEGIVLCWTGTGCSIVANKVPGIRAALCNDAETAKFEGGILSFYHGKKDK